MSSGRRGFSGRKSHYSINRDLERFDDAEEAKGSPLDDLAMGSQESPDRSNSGDESAGSDYIGEDAVSEIKDEDLEKHLRKLTDEYRLSYK